jgi:hypothetical protein
MFPSLPTQTETVEEPIEDTDVEKDDTEDEVEVEEEEDKPKKVKTNVFLFCFPKLSFSLFDPFQY